MNIRNTVIAAAIAAFAAIPAAHAADAAAGAAKAASCEGCHAPSSPTNPHLCGQPASYLDAATKAYKDGSRNHPMMKAMVMALSDEDIANISAHYAAQACN